MNLAKLPLPPKPLCDTLRGAWCQTVHNTLRTTDLLKHITPMMLTPSMLSTNYVTELTYWCANDYLVMEWLTRCLGDDLVTKVAALFSAAIVWAHLSKRFERHSVARVAYLYHQVWTTMCIDAPYLEYLNRLHRYRTEL